jgi:hypothetical protein
MSVYVSNITIPSGADFDQTFILEDSSGGILDLTGYTAASILKKHPESSKVAAVFEIIFPIARRTGQLKIALASSITSSLKPGRYCYDILIDDGQERSRVIEGSALVTAGVTTTIV